MELVSVEELKTPHKAIKFYMENISDSPWVYRNTSDLYDEFEEFFSFKDLSYYTETDLRCMFNDYLDNKVRNGELIYCYVNHAYYDIEDMVRELSQHKVDIDCGINPSAGFALGEHEIPYFTKALETIINTYNLRI